MAVLTLTSPGVLFALWGRPTKWDADRVTEQLRALYEETGRPVIYITRVPADAPPPDGEVRRYIDELMPKFVEYCASYHVILEGKGFVAALKRGVLLSLFQLSWRRGMFFVHAFTSEVIHRIPREDHASVLDVIERARQSGMLAGNAPSTVRPPALGGGAEARP